MQQSSQGYGFFQWSCMDVRVGLIKKAELQRIDAFELGVREDSWESLGLQGDPSSQS